MTAPLAVPIADTGDVVALGPLGRGVAAACGLDTQSQARVALAVTEAAANALIHGGGGTAEFRTAPRTGDCGASLEVVVSDRGAGTADLESKLRAAAPDAGLGLIRQAAETVSAAPARGGGTAVVMGWRLARTPASLDPALQRVGDQVRAEHPTSRLELLRSENRALARLLETLRLSEADLVAEQDEVAALTNELEATNRGLIVLNSDLEGAREAESRLAAIVRSSDDAMSSLDPDTIVTSWNAGAEHLLGYRGADIVGKPVQVLIPDEQRGEFATVIKRLQKGEQAVRYDTWRRRKDGTLVEVTVTLSAMRDSAGQLLGYSAVMRDLTERRHAERHLAAARVRHEVFAERERIARDLHDLVIQRLFASGMALQGVLNLSLSDEIATRVGRVIDDLDTTISEIRSTIFALGRGLHLGASLREELLEVTSKAAEILGFQPHVRFEGLVDFAVPEDVAQHIVAVAREALSNVARHAAASRVEVVVHAGDDIALEVLDNGRGMEQATRRSGLANLAERAEALGGTLTVTNRAGGGTHLVWRVPAD